MFKEEIKDTIIKNGNGLHSNCDISANEIIADIRNKLSPIENLLALLKNRDNHPFNDEKIRRIFDKEIKNVEKSLKYLSDK